MVPYSDVFSGSRDFIVSQAGRRIRCSDHYCVDLRCECTEVLLEFMDLDAKEIGDRHLGAVQLNYDRGCIVDTFPMRAKASTLHSLWMKLSFSERDCRRQFRQRNKHLRLIGDELYRQAGVPRPDFERTPEELLSSLQNDDRTIDRQSFLECAARSEEVTPLLLHALESTVEALEQEVQREDGAGEEVEVDEEDLSPSRALFAVYLLAEMRESKAYPLFLRVLRIPWSPLNEFLLSPFSDMAGPLLASVADGDPGPALELDLLSSGTRAWGIPPGLQCVSSLVRAGELEEAKGRRHFEEILRAKLQAGCEAEETDYETLERNAYAVIEACDFDAVGLEATIRSLYDADLVTDRIYGIGDIERDISARRTWRDFDDAPLIVDAAGELEGWACFEPRPASDGNTRQGALYAGGSKSRRQGAGGQGAKRWQNTGLGEPSSRLPGATLRREEPKVGRNDPCPCGSGKKYKRCCLEN